VILPTPSITSDLIVFGTGNGRAYALEHDGNLRWQVAWLDRITYRPLPYNIPAQFADAALYGPAIDRAGDYAYFGGSDGRVHRFSVAGGSIESSPVLMFFRELEQKSWGFWNPRDANGLERIRPCPISSEPVVWRNRTLLVRTHTNTQGPEGRNGAFLCALRLPDMTMRPGITNNLGALDINDPEFTGSGGVGAVNLNGYSSLGLTGWDPINQVAFINDPGSGMLFDWGDQTDVGGVSMGDGYVFVTDGSGQVAAIPSDDLYLPPSPSGIVKPAEPAGLPPPALPPVEAFPNPFVPARARGGTFKFRNLPAGSRVELYTLAYERVRVLSESGLRAEWDARNEAGQPVASGVYLYKIFFPGDRPAETGRVALVR
jgi:hypothetical protein